MAQPQELFDRLYADLANGIFFKTAAPDTLINLVEAGEKKSVYYVKEPDVITDGAKWDLIMDDDTIRLFIDESPYTVESYEGGQLHMLTTEGTKITWVQQPHK